MTVYLFLSMRRANSLIRMPYFQPACTEVLDFLCIQPDFPVWTSGSCPHTPIEKLICCSGIWLILTPPLLNYDQQAMGHMLMPHEKVRSACYYKHSTNDTSDWLFNTRSVLYTAVFTLCVMMNGLISGKFVKSVS